MAICFNPSASTKSSLFWKNDSVICLQWSSYVGAKPMEFKGFSEAAAKDYLHSTFSVKEKGGDFRGFLLTVYTCGSSE